MLGKPGSLERARHTSILVVEPLTASAHILREHHDPLARPRDIDKLVSIERTRLHLDNRPSGKILMTGQRSAWTRWTVESKKRKAMELKEKIAEAKLELAKALRKLDRELEKVTKELKKGRRQEERQAKKRKSA